MKEDLEEGRVEFDIYVRHLWCQSITNTNAILMPLLQVTIGILALCAPMCFLGIIMPFLPLKHIFCLAEHATQKKTFKKI